MLKRSQSHPRHVPGRLTIPQLAAQLGVSAHWIYDRVHNGAIAITRDEHTGLYLFPDAPSTLDRLQKLRAGELERLDFDTELGSSGGKQKARTTSKGEKGLTSSL